MLVTHLARRRRAALAQLAFVLSALIAVSSAALAQGEVNIYSYREPQLIDPLLKAFTDKTGIKANVVYRRRRPQRAAGRRGAEQPGRSPLHRRCRPPLRGQGRGPHAAGRLEPR